jgi:phthalate 4,5-cis-dihydrodiol dehydrogenase
MAMMHETPVIRLGLIGLGGATNQILPSLRCHPEVRIVAAADLRSEARQRFASAFGATAYAEVEALCRDPLVNTVYVATPHQWHKEHAVMAAACGKHVIVEKPMALTLGDCDAMTQAATRNGVHLLVGHTHSFDPPVRRMREIIRRGELGPLAMVNTWSYSNFLMRPRLQEELDTAQGGGIIFNQVPHQVDMVRLLGGGMVRSVRSMAWALEPGRPTEGSHLTFLQFEDGAAASLAFSGYDYFDSDEFHFWVGESGEEKSGDDHGKARAQLRRFADAREESAFKASVASQAGFGSAPQPANWHHLHCGVTIVSCARGDMRPSADGVLIYGQNGHREVQVARGPAFPDKGSVVDEMLQAIRTGVSPLHDGAWGKATMEVCSAVLQSARERREILLQHQVPARD